MPRQPQPPPGRVGPSRHPVPPFPHSPFPRSPVLLTSRNIPLSLPGSGISGLSTSQSAGSNIGSRDGRQPPPLVLRRQRVGSRGTLILGVSPDARGAIPPDTGPVR